MTGPAAAYIVRVLLARDEGFAATASLAILPGILLCIYLQPISIRWHISD